MRGFAALAPLLAAASPPAPPINPVTTPPPPVTVVEAPVTAADVLALGSDEPGRMTVPVTIGEGGPFPFTIDTGAERTVISRQLAQLLRLETGKQVAVVAMTGRVSTRTAVIPSIAISTVRAKAIEAPVFEGQDLGAPGLIGIDALQGRALTIDFDSRRAEVVKALKPVKRVLDDDPNLIVVEARSLLGQLVVGDAYYRGRRVRIVLDTGTSISMGNAALQRLATRRARGARQIEVVSVTGQAMTADYAVIDELRLGRVTINNLAVGFADAAPFERLGLVRQPALLLGMDALHQFRRVDIDFANRQVRLALPRQVALR